MGSLSILRGRTGLDTHDTTDLRGDGSAPMPVIQTPASHGADAPGEPVIVLDGVKKRFGSFTAVERAHFSIDRGEFFAMLGPSGCGKTTTLKMIAGFEQPSEGRVVLESVDVSRTPPYKRNVNTVFQQYALFPHMTVAENVAFGPKSKKVPKSEYTRRVAEMLDVVRLGDFAHRRPTQLSGGQQQRVALARALVLKPRILLADEPTGNLDTKNSAQVHDFLLQLNREMGMTMVVVTHNMKLARYMQRQMTIHEGKLVDIE